jgi:hypothetical protein
MHDLLIEREFPYRHHLFGWRIPTSGLPSPHRESCCRGMFSTIEDFVEYRSIGDMRFRTYRNCVTMLAFNSRRFGIDRQ